MTFRSNAGIGVLIPSYDRPEMLKTTLQSWLEADSVDQLFVIAEASSQNKLEKYANILENYARRYHVVYRVALEKLGSVKARNALLAMASEHNCTYAVMADDDYILHGKNCLAIMANAFETDKEIGAIGGKVIVVKKRADPDFFLNLPMALADTLSKLIGYVFLDVKHGPRYSEFLPHFFMVKKQVLDQMVRYDEIFDTPTGFREESDFQLQIKHHGYKLLFDPKICVIHLAAEEGGDRPKMSVGKRMYWKARNHAIFIFKWNKSTKKRLWFTMFSILNLSLYRGWHIAWILRGIKDGIQFYVINFDATCFNASKTLGPKNA